MCPFRDSFYCQRHKFKHLHSKNIRARRWIGWSAGSEGCQGVAELGPALVHSEPLGAGGEARASAAKQEDFWGIVVTRLRQQNVTVDQVQQVLGERAASRPVQNAPTSAYSARKGILWSTNSVACGRATISNCWKEL